MRKAELEAEQYQRDIQARFSHAMRRPFTYVPTHGEPKPGLPEPVAQAIESGTKIGRNDPCPCGSGKKYKKCCLDKQQQ